MLSAIIAARMPMAWLEIISLAESRTAAWYLKAWGVCASVFMAVNSVTTAKMIVANFFIKMYLVVLKYLSGKVREKETRPFPQINCKKSRVCFCAVHEPIALSYLGSSTQPLSFEDEIRSCQPFLLVPYSPLLLFESLSIVF